jgi:hypothetical protein
LDFLMGSPFAWLVFVVTPVVAVLALVLVGGCV